MQMILKFTAPMLFMVLSIGCSGGGSGSGGGSPSPQVASITVSPSSASIGVGQTQTSTAQATDQNGAVMTGVSFTWASSNNGVATVTDGVATGVAAGTTDITAASGGVTSNAATLTVTQGANPGNATKSSEELIDEDLKAGKITEELALVYRVYAAFGSPSLPLQYASTVKRGIDSPISTELAQRFPTLSPEAQAAIQPYRIPPIYKGSWGDPDLFSTLPSGKAQPTAVLGAASEVVTPPCDGSRLPLPTLLPGWTLRATAHFNIWYRTATSTHLYTPAQAEAAAGNIALVAEKIYNDLTGFFNKHPLSDALKACNGGDGAIDIYVDSMMGADTAQVSTYPPDCDESPTWMWIAPDEILDPQDARDVFAHEFMHMIDFAYAKGAACKDYEWLSEAAGHWAIDYVYPDDQFEHEMAFYYYQTEFDEPIEGFDSTAARYKKLNGYSDYIFLFYLSRQVGLGTIKSIFEWAQQENSLDALEDATSGAGGLKKIWPEFVVAGWNDWEGGVADDFYKWDKGPPALEAGQKHEFDIGDGGKFMGGEESTKIALEGQRQKTFTFDSSFYSGGGGAAVIEPLSARYLYLKFTDDNVRSIVYNNKPGALSTAIPSLSVQALVKVNGEWRGPEDWTNEPVKTFCRDAKAERIEELVVMYSNSDPARPRESSVIDLKPGGGISFVPTVDVSNTGCWRWEGTVSVTTESTGGPVEVADATAAYERFRDPSLPNGGAGMDVYFTVSGSASYRKNGPFLTVCTVSTRPATASIGASDGAMTIRFNQPDQENNHAVLIGSGSTSMSVIQDVTCPTDPPPTTETTTTTSDVSVGWLSLPANAQISEDGQSFSGRTVEPISFGDTGGTVTSDWNFHAVREQ